MGLLIDAEQRVKIKLFVVKLRTSCLLLLFVELMLKLRLIGLVKADGGVIVKLFSTDWEVAAKMLKMIAMIKRYLDEDWASLC